MLSFSTIRSVAIIGASEDAKKIGNILLAKNQDFSGNIYGINPKGGEAYGKPFYKSISELPEVPDIAVFAIPEAFIYSSLEEAGKYGVKKAIIITAGFKEVGNTEGEKRLAGIAKTYNIRILGPNCLGFADTWRSLNLSFGSRFFEKGNIGIISQSGAMAVAITDVLAERGLGFSSLFSLGNKSDIDESDLLYELAEDPHTDVIAVYLENIARGTTFIKTLREITAKKPVMIMLGGVSEKGKQATASHTGSLSGDRLILESAIRQGGAILTYSLGEYFTLIDIFSRARQDELVGKPIIITNAGGPGVLMTDQCEVHHITLESISDADREVLGTNMPTTMSTRNPIDIIGDADSMRVRQVLENILKIRDKADLIFIFTVQATTDIDAITEVLVEFDQVHREFQPYVCLIGGETVEKARKTLTGAGIFVTDSTESIALAYRKLAERNRLVSSGMGNDISKIETSENTIGSIQTPITAYSSQSPDSYNPSSKAELLRNMAYRNDKNQESATPHSKTPHTETSLSLLSPENTEAILSSHSINTTAPTLCQSLDEAVAYAKTHTPPFVMKVSGSHIAHKTDMDGVQTGLVDADDIREAYEKIQSGAQAYFQNQKYYAVTIERHIAPSPKYEFFFGAKRDANFGDTFVMGTGGIYLSLTDDTRLHIGIPTREDIEDILSGLRFAPIIDGYRGQVAIEKERLIDAIEKLAKLFAEKKEITEIDINPILFENGMPIVVDAKLYTI